MYNKNEKIIIKFIKIIKNNVITINMKETLSQLKLSKKEFKKRFRNLDCFLLIVFIYLFICIDNISQKENKGFYNVMLDDDIGRLELYFIFFNLRKSTLLKGLEDYLLEDFSARYHSVREYFIEPFKKCIDYIFGSNNLTNEAIFSFALVLNTLKSYLSINKKLLSILKSKLSEKNYKKFEKLLFNTNDNLITNNEIEKTTVVGEKTTTVGIEKGGSNESPLFLN